MKAARLSPRFIRQTAEKTKKKTQTRALRRANEPLGMGEQISKHTPHLELYQKEDCPFSHVVRSRLSELGLDYVVHNVPDQLPLKHEQLTQAGGKDQIPFLVDRRTGVKLYESRAILAYLEKEYGIPANTRVGEWLQHFNSRIQAQTDEIAWALRTPYDRARRLSNEFTQFWNSLMESQRMIRNAFRATEHKPAPQKKEKTPATKAA
jgi:glutathione S-transferase